MLSRTILAGLAATAALGLAACGDDDNDDSGSSANTPPAATQPAGGGGTDTSGGTGGTSAGQTSTGGSSSGGGSKLEIAADPSGGLSYDKKTLTATAGKDTLDFTNDSQTPHNVAVEGAGDKEVGATKIIQGGKASVSLDLKPGKYTFYCEVGSHRQAGMEGTLTVK